MVQPSRSDLICRVRLARQQAIDNLKKTTALRRTLLDDLQAGAPSVPHHQRITNLGNAAAESDYHKEFVEYFGKEKERVTEWFFAARKGMDSIEEKVLKLQAKIEQAAPVDTDKIVKQILDLCAAMPAVNRTLCTHYLENEPWQAAISELRAEMDNYRPAIHAFVLAETNEAIEQQWSRFAHDKLEPLRDTIFDQSETIARLENERASYCSDVEGMIKLYGRNVQLRQRPLERQRKVTQVLSLVLVNQQSILQAVLGWEQAAKTKLEDLEHKLTESEANAKSLEESLEEKANAANTKAEQLQGNVTAAEGNAKGMEKKLEAANTTAKDLQGKVTAAEKRAKEMEEKLEEADTKAKDLQSKVTAAEQKATELEEKVNAANARADALQEQVNTAEGKRLGEGGQ